MRHDDYLTEHFCDCADLRNSFTHRGRLHKFVRVFCGWPYGAVGYGNSTERADKRADRKGGGQLFLEVTVKNAATS